MHMKQPSSNEVTSNENQSSSSETAAFDNDPFTLEPIFDNSQSKTKPSLATSPKSNREYITSFTTTTTTTRKPHIEKGVKIIRELVEQAKTTQQPDSDRPIQSLTTTTTTKPTITKTNDKTIAQKPSISSKTTTTPLPPNHKSEAETVRGRTVTINMTRPMMSSTKTTRTPTVATTRAMSPVTRSPEMARTTDASPIGINDIEDLSKILKSIQSTTTKKDRTTKTTTTTTPKTKTTTDDLNFIRQVVSYSIYVYVPCPVTHKSLMHQNDNIVC